MNIHSIRNHNDFMRLVETCIETSNRLYDELIDQHNQSLSRYISFDDKNEEYYNFRLTFIRPVYVATLEEPENNNDNKISRVVEISISHPPDAYPRIETALIDDDGTLIQVPELGYQYDTIQRFDNTEELIQHIIDVSNYNIQQ